MKTWSDDDSVDCRDRYEPLTSNFHVTVAKWRPAASAAAHTCSRSGAATVSGTSEHSSKKVLPGVEPNVNFDGL